MSDDQTFDVGGLVVKDCTATYPTPKATIGQTWTDSATGEVVMVVPVDWTLASLKAMRDTLEKYKPPYTFLQLLHTANAMLASLRAKEGK